MEFVTVRSGSDSYLYSPDAIARNKSVTLAAGHSAVYSFANKDFADVDATKVTRAIAITGNGDSNIITASSVVGGNSIDGGAGNDLLIGYGTAKATPADGSAILGDVFIYQSKGGKDSIQGFAANDSLSVDINAIKSGSTNRNDNLIFKLDSSNTITFDSDTIKKVALAGSSTNSLTKDGVISLTSAAVEATENSEAVLPKYTLKLFAEQKGKIDLTDAVYDGVTGIDATNVKNGLVTMVGGTAGGTFTFANNKKADVFQYGGGEVDLNGYVSDSDKIDLNKASLKSFAVDTDGHVTLDLSDNGSITMADADFSKKEVLLRSPGSSSYKSYVFAKTGVLYDKAKNPAQATIYSGAAPDTTVDGAIKKIVADSGVSGISIQAGSKNNTFIDASAAVGNVTLVSNSKNDKFTGGKCSDTFVFTAGKDVITNYSTADSIAFGEGTSFNLGDAKITQSKKSVTLKFNNKDKLTIKADSSNIGNINIGGKDYGFGKNAIITETAGSKTASLTSEFSGTYKVSGDVTVVDGSAVTKKNFTIQGTKEDETLIAGGAANKKTTLKGGGGADNLVGGESQDTFFYAKSDTGAATITNFDYAKDHLKIKGTIKDGGITKTGTLSSNGKTTGGLKFEMTNGGSMTITQDSKNNEITAGSQILIKANNTLYWFEGSNLCTATDSESKSAIKSVLRDQANYAIVDLNYSTNLVKKNLASVSETTFTAATAEGYKIR